MKADSRFRTFADRFFEVDEPVERMRIRDAKSIRDENVVKMRIPIR